MNKKPKILFFDIETAPNLAWVWGKWEQNVIEFDSHWYIIGFSAKWMDGKQITKGLIDYPGYGRNKDDDSRIVKDIWKLFDEADIIVAHNGDQFDVKKCNARFSYHSMKPPSPYNTVDTKKVAKKYFNFVSNSLNDLGDFLKLGRKLQTGGFELWKGCMLGNKNSWRLMKKYNAQDVLLLEKVYYHFLPWMKSHPNYGIFIEGEVCPKCGSDKLNSRGLARTISQIYRRAQCRGCGGWCRFKEKKRKYKIMLSI